MRTCSTGQFRRCVGRFNDQEKIMTPTQLSHRHRLSAVLKRIDSLSGILFYDAGRYFSDQKLVKRVLGILESRNARR